MKKKISKTAWTYAFARFMIFILFIISFVSLFISSDKSDSGRSRNIFVCIQCLLLFVCSFIPRFVEKKWRLDIPNFMEIIFLLFCGCAMFLGEICDFYATIYWWDSMLHTLSGCLLAILGFSIIRLLNDSEKVSLNMSPIFVSVFVVCFAVFAGVVWEIIEYLADGFTGSNMQRYMDSNDNSIVFKGRRALKDTMKDLILDTSGALFIAILGYFDLSLQKGWFSKWTIIPEKKENGENSVEMAEISKKNIE